MADARAAPARAPLAGPQGEFVAALDRLPPAAAAAALKQRLVALELERLHMLQQLSRALAAAL